MMPVVAGKHARSSPTPPAGDLRRELLGRLSVPAVAERERGAFGRECPNERLADTAAAR